MTHNSLFAAFIVLTVCGLLVTLARTGGTAANDTKFGRQGWIAFALTTAFAVAAAVVWGMGA